MLERSRPAPHFYVSTRKLDLCDMPNVRPAPNARHCPVPQLPHLVHRPPSTHVQSPHQWHMSRHTDVSDWAISLDLSELDIGNSSARFARPRMSKLTFYHSLDKGGPCSISGWLPQPGVCGRRIGRLTIGRLQPVGKLP